MSTKKHRRIADTLKQRLPPRIYETVEYVARGFTAREAAKQMGITFGTAQHYLRLALEYANCTNRAQLMAQFGRETRNNDPAKPAP
jgi:DNA-binding NarL/FixJ family response regulator